jgi:hypothetical protein
MTLLDCSGKGEEWKLLERWRDRKREWSEQPKRVVTRRQQQREGEGERLYYKLIFQQEVCEQDNCNKRCVGERVRMEGNSSGTREAM